MVSNVISKKKPISLILISIGLLFILLIIYFQFGLHFNFMQGDVLGYWQDSLQWQTPFHSYHLPGYPLMVALVHGLSFGIVPPVVLMWSINLIAYLVSILLVYRILTLAQIPEKSSSLAAILFALWPLAGLTYTVFPIADLPVISFFLCGLYFNQKNKPLLSALFMALSLVTHKAIWLFVFLFFIFDRIHRRNFFSKRTLIHVTVTILPLSVLWGFGWIYHQDPFWLISSNLQTELASRSQLPLLDGLLGTLLKGGTAGFFKFLILLSFTAISGLALFLSCKNRTSVWPQALAIAIACTLLFLLINQYEIWAAVRFSRLLVIPLALALADRVEKFLEKPGGRILAKATILVFIFSQFAYAWYIDYYHG